MDKIKKEEFKNVGGGYVEIEDNLKNGQRIVRAFDNDTKELLAESVLYGSEANAIGAPLDNELISAFQKFDQDYHSNKLKNK